MREQKNLPGSLETKLMMVRLLANATFLPSIFFSFVSYIVFLFSALIFLPFGFLPFLPLSYYVYLSLCLSLLRPLASDLSLAFIGQENALAVRLISLRITILGMRISMDRSSMFEENRAPLQDCWRRTILALEEQRVGERN